MKLSIKVLLSATAVLLTGSLYAQESQIIKEVVVGSTTKEVASATAANVAKKTTSSVVKKGGMVAFSSRPSLGKGAKIPKVQPVNLKTLSKNIETAVAKSEVPSLTGSQPKNEVKIQKLSDELSYSVLTRVKDFVARHGRYPRGQFFENGKEITQLTYAQQQEKMVFEDAQKFIEKLTDAKYSQEIAAFKKECMDAESIRSKTEQALDELDAFIRAKHRFPQNHFGEELKGLSAEQEVNIAMESVLREKIDRLIAEKPNDVWAQEMAKLKEDFKN